MAVSTWTESGLLRAQGCCLQSRLKNTPGGAWRWWPTPLIQPLGDRGRQSSEFEASLVYKASSRTPRTVSQINLVSRKTQNKTKTKNTPGGRGVIKVSGKIHFHKVKGQSCHRCRSLAR